MSRLQVSFFFFLTSVISFLVGVGVGPLAGLSFNASCYSPIASAVSREPKKVEGLARTMTSTPLNSSTSWCPKAVCLNSNLCQPCQRRFLIILATARSASTTLDYMIDNLPGMRMSGENNDQLQAIRGMMDNVMLKKIFQYKRKVVRKGAWGHNPIPPGAAACVGQKMIETINPPLTDQWGAVLEDDADTIIGFKTIRFLHNGTTEADTVALVRWVQSNFPCAKFLVNIRSETTDQAKSQKVLRKIAQHDAEELLELNERMRNLVNLFGGDQAYLLDSSKWTTDLESLNQAVDWLGFHKSCHFQELLEFNTPSVRGYGAAKSQLDMNPECRYVGS
jgi:hypothetical protein